jgi:hypothetical protein
LRRRARSLVALACVLVILSPDVLFAGRCATGLRGEKPERFTAPRLAYRRAAGLVAAPVTIAGAHVLTTAHFRVLWGDAYSRTDPEWADSDGDGYPDWAGTLADALESALACQKARGFSEPLGLDRYYLDAYVANTGLVVDGQAVTISPGYYAYTEIDPTYDAAYFVVNDDFSSHVSDELGVLRATVAHELFHAVQAVYYPWADDVKVPASRWDREGWWFEATATWMEEVCEPDSNDYVTYVRSFLSHPEAALTSTDGLREYGAAIFPGFLWLRRGGAGFWQEVFTAGFGSGLEAALDEALLRRGFHGLGETVAAFWSLAAHPEDTWPDGAQFQSSGAPTLLRSISQYPAEVSTTSLTAPGRFGASLLRLPASPSTLSLRLTSLGSPGAKLLVASSARLSSQEPECLSPPASGDPVTYTAPGAEERYLALVNASATDSPAPYRLALGEPSQTPEPGSGGGSGGCFLASLGL